MLSYGLLVELLKGVTWFTGLLPILVAALCGPALLRAQLALLGSGQEEMYFGPATRYRRIQRFIEQRIDQLGAAAQSDWISKVMIKVERLPIEDVAFRSTNYIKALDNVKAGWREEMLRYIDEAAVDDGVATNHRIRYIVQKLVDNNCRQCVKTLFIVAKKS